MQTAQTTVDPSEVAKFEAMAAEWWDPKGKFQAAAPDESLSLGLHHPPDRR